MINGAQPHPGAPDHSDDAIAQLLAVMPDSTLPALLGQTLRRLLDNGDVTDIPGIAWRLGPEGFMTDACAAFMMNLGQMTSITDERTDPQ